MFRPVSAGVELFITVTTAKITTASATATKTTAASATTTATETTTAKTTTKKSTESTETLAEDESVVKAFREVANAAGELAKAPFKKVMMEWCDWAFRLPSKRS